MSADIMKEESSAGPEEADGYQSLVSLAADALADILGQTYVVASWEAGSELVRIRTQQLLAKADANTLLASIQTGAASGDVPFPAKSVGTSLAGPGMRNGDAATRLRSCTSIPLQGPGRCLGILCIAGYDDVKFTEERIESFRKLAGDVVDALRMLWSVIRAERNRFRTVVEALQDGLIMFDATGRVLMVNQAGRRHLSYPTSTPAEQISIEDVKLADVAEGLREALALRIENSNKIFTGGDDHRRILGMRLQLLRDEQRRPLGWLACLRDITESWQADRVRTELVSFVSHELHTPMTSMRDAVELVVSGETGPLNAQQRRLLSIVRDDMVRLDDLLTKYLTQGTEQVRDLEAKKLERRIRIDLPVQLDSAFDQFSATARKKGIRLEKAYPQKQMTVSGNRDLFKQLLSNLLDNALKYTPAGGMVTIGAEEEEGAVLIWVEDTGMGIAEDKLGSIFEAYNRGDAAEIAPGSGYGLGLHIAAGIVKQFNGQIWAESESDKGACFYVRLPRE